MVRAGNSGLLSDGRDDDGSEGLLGPKDRGQDHNQRDRVAIDSSSVMQDFMIGQILDVRM